MRFLVHRLLDYMDISSWLWVNVCVDTYRLKTMSSRSLMNYSLSCDGRSHYCYISSQNRRAGFRSYLSRYSFLIPDVKYIKYITEGSIKCLNIMAFCPNKAYRCILKLRAGNQKIAGLILARSEPWAITIVPLYITTWEIIFLLYCLTLKNLVWRSWCYK